MSTLGATGGVADPPQYPGPHSTFIKTTETYSQTLDRYLIANTAYLDPVHRRPVSYRNPSDGSQKGIQLSMFESPTPWGPWALFYNWTQSCPNGRCLPPLYTPNFPAPFVDDAEGPLLSWAAPCDPLGGMHRPWVCQRYAHNGSPGMVCS